MSQRRYFFDGSNLTLTSFDTWISSSFKFFSSDVLTFSRFGGILFVEGLALTVLNHSYS